MNILRTLTVAASAGLMMGGAAQASTVFSSVLNAEQSTTDPQTASVSGDAGLEFTYDEDGEISGLAMSIVFSDGIDFSAIIGDGPGQIDDTNGTAAFSDDDVDATRFHIHAAARGNTGGVVFGIFDIVVPGAVATGPDGDVNDSTLTFNADGTTTLTTTWSLFEGTGGATLLGFLVELASANTGGDVGLYYNLHTVAAPAGLIRGQIVGQNDVNPVPVPAALPLFVGAVVAGGALRRRRARA